MPEYVDYAEYYDAYHDAFKDASPEVIFVAQKPS